MRGDTSTEAAVVGATLSVPYGNRSEEDDKRIPACIADIVDDTVGVVSGVCVVLFGSFAEAMCAALVLYASSDVLGTLGKHRGFPCFLLVSCKCGGILTLVLRIVISRVRDAYGAVEKESTESVLTLCIGLTTLVVVVLSMCGTAMLSISERMTKELAALAPFTL